MKNSAVRQTTLTAVARTIKGNAFSYLPNYQTDNGDVNDYWLLLGYNHQNAMVHDFQVLSDKIDLVHEKLGKDFCKEDITLAINEMLVSLETRLSDEEKKEALRLQNNETLKRSDAMTDAFEYKAKGIFLHIETNVYHVRGLEIKKRVILKSEKSYKEPVSDKAKIKAKIPLILGFRQSKIRSFKLPKIDYIRLQGATI
jgi:hypothetical protein